MGPVMNGLVPGDNREKPLGVTSLLIGVYLLNPFRIS